MQLIDRKLEYLFAGWRTEPTRNFCTKRRIIPFPGLKQLEDRCSSWIQQMNSITGRVVDKNLSIERVTQETGPNSW
jgi:hypothetical protein